MTYELEMALRYGTLEDALELAGVTPEELWGETSEQEES